MLYKFVINDEGIVHRLPPGGLTTYPAQSVWVMHERFPFLKPFYFSFETEFSAAAALSWNIANYYVAPLAACLYLLFCYCGTKYMKNREPFDLRTPLKYWNLALAIFSFMGMVRVVPQLACLVCSYGFEASLASPPVYAYGHGAAGFWTLLFIYSKFFELVDTVFIILRKRPLSFLHWYHHATVLLYTWDAYTWEQPAGIYFVAMNFSVHAVMYFYYFLAAQLRRPLSWGIFVTVAQISQMFVGVGVTFVSMYFAFSFPYRAFWRKEQIQDALSHGHYITPKNLYWACLMYSTYFYLFAEYFVKRYVKGKEHSRKAHKHCKHLQ
ncbi:fatty acid elongation protein, putative [Eimeria tenella]|uniref:Elongation of fatty acids protein n=1 Tax=Eimeria tenella TaxID=5802 RepID=U6KNG2_EIMTE|nr:fatty acid elongation protein, putative [Eimeria tenella]CDJ36988.1 fatty acid elongation protein, putative [Eimeria tenella]|eukprot:XP_013227826.1 fatty acid elongation protein, putative [Eimeria tenella]